MEHPFIRDLRDGSLDDQKLRFYFEQNTTYIDAVVRARALVSSHATLR